jgi:hypothetical protein
MNIELDTTTVELGIRWTWTLETWRMAEGHAGPCRRIMHLFGTIMLDLGLSVRRGVVQVWDVCQIELRTNIPAGIRDCALPFVPLHRLVRD